VNFRPLTLRAANDFVEAHHRHSARTSNDGGKFAVGLEDGGQLVGVAIVGRPIARLLHDDTTAEVLRVCVLPGAPMGACSKLYAQCDRIWKLMGGKRIITYTLKRETGASLRGAGWQITGEVDGAQWGRPSRARIAKPIHDEPKLRWEPNCA
jgi:hypothetical protein